MLGVALGLLTVYGFIKWMRFFYGFGLVILNLIMIFLVIPMIEDRDFLAGKYAEFEERFSRQEAERKMPAPAPDYSIQAMRDMEQANQQLLRELEAERSKPAEKDTVFQVKIVPDTSRPATGYAYDPSPQMHPFGFQAAADSFSLAKKARPDSQKVNHIVIYNIPQNLQQKPYGHNFPDYLR